MSDIQAKVQIYITRGKNIGEYANLNQLAGKTLTNELAWPIYYKGT